MIKIGENIKRLREERNWTQTELSQITGIHPNYISAIERGVRNPSLKIVGKLSEAFAIDEMVLRYGEREKPEEMDKDLQLLHENVERAFKAAQAVSDADKHEFMAKVLRMTKALYEEGQKD